MSKELGNDQFKAKNYDKAIEFYTQAISENPTDHTIYGNRAASYHNLKKYNEALADGEKCIEIKPDWGKGYLRKGQGLTGLRKFDEALESYEKGLEIEPSNKQIQQGVQIVL